MTKKALDIVEVVEAQEEESLESQMFREALLESLNGQKDDMQRLIKLMDNRFTSHTRRMRKLEGIVAGMSDSIAPVIDDVKFTRRIATLTPPTIGFILGVIGLLRAVGVL